MPLIWYICMSLPVRESTPHRYSKHYNLIDYIVMIEYRQVVLMFRCTLIMYAV